MRISLIVPFYNVEAYLRDCLDSIVHQTYRDLEIILVDDCSPDNSYAIACEYANKDSRIKIIRHEVNKGLGGARNSGVCAATGEYVWFIDSDDYIFSLTSVEEIVKELTHAHFPEMVGFGAVNLYPDGYKELVLHEVRSKELFRDPLALLQYKLRLNKVEQPHSPLDGYAWHRWFKRSFWQRIGVHFLEKTLFEDMFLINMTGLAQGFLALRAPHYTYRKRFGSILASGYPANFDAHINRFMAQIINLQQTHRQAHFIQYCNYMNLGMLSLGSFIGESWRETLVHSLKREPQRAKELYLSFVSLFGDLIASDPSLKEIEALGAFKPDELQRLVDFFQMMHRENPSINHYKVLNRLFQPKRYLLKDVIRTTLPFGLLNIVLEQRGWRVLIKKKESMH